MKKITAATIGVLLVAASVVLGDPSPADQKWLEAVQKMVSKGEKKVSTPDEGRVSLLKDWAAKQDYSVKVTKTEAGFVIEFSGKTGGKTVAQK